jgi:hypothetical protein
MFKRKENSEIDHRQIKRDDFIFGQIEKYFLKSSKDGLLQTISDRTCQDLDLEEVFRYIDRTSSVVGQQFLYNQIRTIPSDSQRVDRMEYLIQMLNESTGTKSAVLKQLRGLASRDAYYISALLFENHMAKPRWFPIVYVLSLLSVCAISLSILFPQVLIFLLFLLPVNFGFHYWNKNNLYQYGSSIPQLVRLNQAAKELSKFRGLDRAGSSLKESIAKLDDLGFSMSLFKIEAKLQSEVGLIVEYLIELLKALFLIEPILLFKTLKALDSLRPQIQKIYTFVAEIDVALSVGALRETTTWCRPLLSESKKEMNILDMCHPLIYKGVPNSIGIGKKSVLLTGSNMSGKTTFIRTVGLNAILAQTINTCFAKEFTMPQMRIHSAVRIADDLLNEKSYYFEEVLTIKKLLDEVESESLFLLDELFKGTNTTERIAAGKAILSYLNNGNNIVFVSTHDRELAAYLHDTYDVYHFTEVIQGNDIEFDYKIKTGSLKTTNAIRILELNGFPEVVIREAVEISDRIAHDDAILKRLNI